MSIKGYQRLAEQSRQIQITIGLDQRSEAFAEFYPLGISGREGWQRADDTIFRLYSAMDYKTGRDAYMYNFSRDVCDGERDSEWYARLPRCYFLSLEENLEITDR